MNQVFQKAVGVFFLLFLAFGAASAHAQTQSYHVYIDADIDDATGCAVTLTNTGGSQTFPGFEYRLSVSVAGTTVSSTTLSTCSGSSFGGAVALGSSHPLAITDIGTAVTDHIELGLPLANLIVPGNSVRLVIGTDGDFIATVTPMGGPIIMPLAFSGGEPHGIPLLPPVALALLGLAVGFIGWRNHKKHPLAAMCLCMLVSGTLLSISLAWAAGRITFDGNLTGWSGIPALASGNTGDHTGSIDLLKFFAAIDDGDLKLRIDANSGRASTQPPVPAPIPGDPLDARLPTLSVTGVQHLAINQPWVLNLTAKDSQGTTIPVSVHPNSAHPSDITASGTNPLSFTWTPNNGHIGQHVIKVTATDSDGRTIVHDLLIAVTDPASIPVDPVTVAPPLAPGGTPFQKGTEFIYKGSDPIQIGVAGGTIQADRAAILRGIVRDRNNQPLSGVTVTVLDHPEYGATKTRADGWFDLGVNGGGILVLDYQKPGYLRAQRKVDVPWRDYAIAEDTVLIKLDDKTTPITLGNPEWQAAIGTETDDARGKRTFAVLFPPNTTASLTFKDGTRKTTDHITFRSTEFTVGDNGPNAMPGELPMSVGYTYAVELSADEAIASGAQHVEFNQSVYGYLDNFLAFPVGVVVPNGWYDYQRAAWIAADNGRVIKILSIQNGKAVVQVTEESRPATASELIEHGITDGELEALAKMYPVGTTLWRVPLAHFSPCDLNFRLLPGEGSNADNNNDDEECDFYGGCEIYPEGYLGQRIAIPGSPFDLYYRSNRTDASTLEIPLTRKDVEVLPSLQKIYARVDIAGRRFEHEVPPPFVKGMSWTFRWDGRDAYDRVVAAGAEATVFVDQRYPSEYAAYAQADAKAFASISATLQANIGTSVQLAQKGNNINSMFFTTNTWKRHLYLSSPDVLLSNAGGWALDGLKFYDIENQRFYRGGGTVQSAAKLDWQLKTYASLYDGGDIESAQSAPDNAIYAAQPTAHRIVRIDPDGSYTVVAGDNGQGFSGDGGPAAAAQLAGPGDISLGRDGSIFFIDQYGARIRKIDPQGIIHTIAGNGHGGTVNEEGLATDRAIAAFLLTVDRDGNLFYASQNGNSVYQITVHGVIRLTGTMPRRITAMAADPSSGLWVATENSIYAFPPGGAGHPVIGGSAVSSIPLLTYDIRPSHVLPDRNGGVYFLDTLTEPIVAHLSADGVLKALYGAQGVMPVLRADGELVFTRGNSLEQKFTGLPEYTTLGGYAIAQRDAIHLDRFNGNGLHEETVNSLTGAQTASYDYDANGYLINVAYPDGSNVAFERDAQGRVSAITGIHGERTELAYNGEFLSLVTLPDGNHHAMQYLNSNEHQGLMSAYTDPNGNTDRFEYGIDGKLVRNIDPKGGGWRLASNEVKVGDALYIDKTVTSALGKTRTHRRGKGGNGSLSETIAPDGLKTRHTTEVQRYPDGTSQTLQRTFPPDGSQIIRSRSSDPVHGMVAAGESTSVSFVRNFLSYESYRNHMNGQWSESRYVNGQSYITRYSYGQLSHSTPAGASWKAWVDDYLQPLELYPEGLAPISYTWQNNRLAEVSSSGNAGHENQTRRSTAAYDGNGRLASLTNGLGQSTAYGYDVMGRIVSTSLPGNRSIGYQYDANGNLTSLTTPAGVTHQFQFDAINQPTDYDAPNSSTVWRYNLDRDLTAIERPGGLRIGFSRDLGGRVTKITTPENDIDYTYNNKGQLKQVSARNVTLDYLRSHNNDPDMTTLITGTRWSGPINGMVDNKILADVNLQPAYQHINAGGEDLYIERDYDGSGRLRSIDRAGRLSPVKLGYGNHGRLAALEFTANIHATHLSRWQYNDFGELILAAHTGPYQIPDLEAMRSALIAKAVVLKAELLGEINRLGTCQRQGWPARMPTRSMVWDEWRYVDQLDEATLARLTEEYGQPQSRTPDFCTEEITALMDDIIGYAQSQDNNWLNVIANSLGHVHSQASGGAVLITDVGGGNTPLSDDTSFVTTDIQNLFDDIEALRQKIAAGQTDLGFMAQFAYQRDVLGRITKQSATVLNNATEQEYQYDVAGRLIEHKQGSITTTWGYDANGNRTHENGTLIASYDSEDRMQSYKANTYSYNAAGDLRSKQNASGTTNYTYDSLGNLTSVTLPGGTIIDYLIDPENRRVGKRRNGALQYGLLYQDSLNPIAELDAGGNIRSVFLYAEKGNVPSEIIMGAKRYRVISDHLGSVRAVVDIDDGTVKQEMDYGVWGNVTRDTNPGFQPFGFAGGIYDPDTKLTRFGARDYDAETGRWTAKDPIHFNGGDPNLYGYVANDPVNFVDPTGLATQAEINIAKALLTKYYPNEFKRWPESIITGDTGDSLGATDIFGNITLSSKKFGENGECTANRQDIFSNDLFLHIIAHEMLHVNENIFTSLLNRLFAVNNPLGVLHRNLDDKAADMITRDILNEYIRDLNQFGDDCECTAK